MSDHALLKPPRLLAAVLALLAFAAGTLAVGWRLDHLRLACYRDLADEQLVADSKCEHPRLW